MGDFIIIVVLVLLVLLAIPSSIKHFKGQGGCCGGGNTVKEHKKLDAPKIGEKEILIEGMHCENCKNSVERAVNNIDGAVCKVNLKKKRAKVSYSKEISDEILRETIENVGFEVREIVKI